MYTVKRMCIYLFIFLFIISLYKDMTVGTVIKQESPQIMHDEENLNQINPEQYGTYRIVSVTVGYGETVLSIIEKINDNQMDNININNVLVDFEQLNPSADPYHLKPNTDYFFPVYSGY